MTAVLPRQMAAGDPSTLTLLQHLWSPQRRADGLFGTSVAIEGDVAVVGAPKESGMIPNTGAAHVFESLTGPYVHAVLVRSTHGWNADGYGTAVAIDDLRVLVGAPGEEGLGGSAGQAYIH